MFGVHAKLPSAVACRWQPGAVHLQDNSRESYRSRVPTIDGRVEPDLAGRDSASAATYCSAAGISRCRAGRSALPPAYHRHVGGGAQGPTLRIRTNVAMYYGAGAENLYGTGVLHSGTARRMA